MPTATQEKGSRGEREIVELFESYGVDAQRVPLSGSAGGLFSGDIVINEDLRAEVKRRKGGQGFTCIEKWKGDNDILFVRKDYSKALAVLDAELLAEIMAGRQRRDPGPGPQNPLNPRRTRKYGGE